MNGFDDKTYGDRWLCAWATSEKTSRIQTRDPEIAKRLKKLPDCTQVGYSVTGGYLRIFAMPYTIEWVAKNVIEKLTIEFPRENGV